MSEWQECTLGDVLTLQRGFDLPVQDRKNGAYPVIASTGTVGYHKEATVKGPGVVIGRSGSIGGGQYIAGNFWPLNTTLWVKDFKNNNERFCYYLLKTIDFQQFNAGSGVPTLNRNHVHPLPVRLAPRSEQNRIVDLLGSIDDKIELSQRMNETLEAMARALFKSWFVDFDPVRAKAEGRKPEGMDAATAALFPAAFNDDGLPEGWTRGTIKELCQRVESGGTPSRKNAEYWDGGHIPWLTSGEVRQKVVLDTQEKITQKGLEESSAKIWPPMSTVVAMYGATAGQVTLLANPVSANQACCALIPKKYTQCFVFLKTSQSVEIYEGQARGSAQQNLNKSIVSDLKTILPPEDILSAFEVRVKNYIDLIIQSFKECETLSTLRDTLLPKLISGELRIDGVAPVRKEAVG